MFYSVLDTIILEGLRIPLSETIVSGSPNCANSRRNIVIWTNMFLLSLATLSMHPQLQDTSFPLKVLRNQYESDSMVDPQMCVLNWRAHSRTLPSMCPSMFFLANIFIRVIPGVSSTVFCNWSGITIRCPKINSLLILVCRRTRVLSCAAMNLSVHNCRLFLVSSLCLLQLQFLWITSWHDVEMSASILAMTISSCDVRPPVQNH
uniref:Transmembrane protein n=1 Tax=Heterorhabditis bacteriophora TaxID=37862 RepID=A0A1I7WAD6_HETBA